MTTGILLEACVDSLESSIAAEEGGADRLELCADLLEGGTTPSAGTIDLVVKNVNIPVMVMIRPRGGDFCYSNYEFDEMKRDIELAKQYNILGAVFGILKENGTIDKNRTRELIQLARPLKITFHRAFDMTRDPLEALDDLIELGIERVLTSGRELTVVEGIETLKELIERGRNKIIIMPGGGVDENNAAGIISNCGAKEIHASARQRKESKMKFRNPKTTMGDSNNISEYELMATSSERIRKIKRAINA